MIYLFVTLLLLSLSYIFDIKGRKKNRDFWYNAVLIILILIAGLRWRLGVDTLAYINRFYFLYPPLSDFSFKEYYIGKDPFYALINSFVISLGGRFYMVQLIQASIVNVLIFKYIKKHSNYIFTCILFYFFISYINYTMEVMRGSISIAICLWGNDYIQEKKRIKGYLLYALALMFHAQTLVIFILPFLFFLQFNKKGIIVLLGAFIIGTMLQHFLGEYAILFEENESIENKISRYAASDRYGEANGNLTYYVLIILIKIIYPILSLLYVKKYCANEKIKSLEPFVMLGLFFVFIQLSFPIAFRYVYYYELYYALIYSEVFVSLTSKSRKYVKNVLFIKSFVIFFPILFYYGYIRYKTHKYHPYSSVIEKTINNETEKVFQERIDYFPPDKNLY